VEILVKNYITHDSAKESSAIRASLYERRNRVSLPMLPNYLIIYVLHTKYCFYI